MGRVENKAEKLTFPVTRHCGTVFKHTVNCFRFLRFRLIIVLFFVIALVGHSESTFAQKKQQKAGMWFKKKKEKKAPAYQADRSTRKIKSLKILQPTSRKAKVPKEKPVKTRSRSQKSNKIADSFEKPLSRSYNKTGVPDKSITPRSRPFREDKVEDKTIWQISKSGPKEMENPSEKYNKRYRKTTKAMQYGGSMKRGKKRKEIVYEGDIVVKNNFLKVFKRENKTQATGHAGNIKQKDNRQKNMAADLLTIKTKSKLAKTRYNKKLSEKMHQHSGNMRIKPKIKDKHPSIVHQYGHTRTKEQKLKRRKFSLWWFRKNKNAEQAPHLREKPKKQKYDSRENEIWYY